MRSLSWENWKKNILFFSNFFLQLFSPKVFHQKFFSWKITCARKYFRKKFDKKLFPWRNAPAIETTTTWRSLIVSSSRIGLNSSNFNLNSCLIGTIIWIGLAGVSVSPNASWAKIRSKQQIKTNFILKTLELIWHLSWIAFAKTELNNRYFLHTSRFLKSSRPYLWNVLRYEKHEMILVLLLLLLLVGKNYIIRRLDL